MVLYKRKPVALVSRPPHLQDDQEVWKRFSCELTGHSGLTFFDALQSEIDASGEVDDAFPDALKGPILRKVQFSTISRIDHLVDHVYEVILPFFEPFRSFTDIHQEFKYDFFPGENILVILDDGNRSPGLLREKTKFPELLRPDGSVERSAYARYTVSLNTPSNKEFVVEANRLIRDRKTFTKQRLRSFLKKTIDHESWIGAPWCVKSKIAQEYQINSDIPPHLTYEHQMAQRKANLMLKKNDFDGHVLNFSPGLPQLKPKGQKSKRGGQDLARLSEEYQRALAANPDFSKIPQAMQQQQIEHLLKGPNGVNGFHPIAAKGVPKQPPQPPPPKYPIEDLELAPVREKAPRPAVKFLSVDLPMPHSFPEEPASGILMHSVGPLLETWDTLNVYCEVFQLDSFTFDDYIEALQLTHDTYHCQLLVEIHCAVLKKLVNDVNDKNGQVQFSLPESNLPGSEDSSLADTGSMPSPTPEPEIKPSGRTTRSSLAKSEAAELKAAEAAGHLPSMENKVHRAAEMVQSTRAYDWKMRLRKRDFKDGAWVYIIVGLLYQLSHDPRRKRSCDEVLNELAPSDREATVETAISQYTLIDINTRVRILQILCMLSMETKAIRLYMEECSNNMTEFRKERLEMQRKRRGAMEDLQALVEERKALQPRSRTASPVPELEGLNDSKLLNGTEDEMEVDNDEVTAMDTEDEEPHQGRSLRRANDRAAQRKKRAEEERLRKERAQAEKAKKPSKQEKQLEKIGKKIEEAKDQIKEYEEEILVLESDLRESDCPRTRVLGKDRFWNRYYWFERNAMPYAGLPDSSTAFTGYANGCLWVQGPDDMERQGFIELCASENAQYYNAFRMSVPERKIIEEGETHVFNARQWGYYDEPDDLDKLIGWLDNHGTREVKLRKELQAQRNNISKYMVQRKEFLDSSEDKKLENGEPPARMSTRTKTYLDPATTRRCFAWSNHTAEREIGHIHSEQKHPVNNRKQAKSGKRAAEDDVRQTRTTNRQGKPLTRQGIRYTF
ncbi:MAG: hypothetical protein Q9223_002170 [Gallowayella weberi]